MPYLVMAAVALLMLAAVWCFWPSPLRVWIFITTGGSITIGDLFVNAIFNLYEYKPGLLRGRADNYLGVLIAECLFVPAYYTVLSVVPPRFRAWVMGISFAPLLLIEWLFEHWQIYEHHAWRYTHSIVLFICFSLVAAWSIRAFEQTGYGWWQRIALVAGSVYLAMNLWGLIVFGILQLGAIHLGLTRNAVLDLVISSLMLHAFPFTSIGLTGIWTGWIRRRRLAVLAAVLMITWVSILKGLYIWAGRGLWTPVVDGGLVIVVHYLLSLLDQWMEVRA